MNQLAHIQHLCQQMEDLVFEGGLPPFDRVRLSAGPGGGDELWFLWEERKLCVAVEITADPDQLAAALSLSMANAAVLN